MKTIATLACALAATMAGCGQDSDPAEQAPSEPAGPMVVYERGGGIAGVIESLAIEADGSATLTVGVERQEHEFQLREAELERLEEELAAADFDAEKVLRIAQAIRDGRFTVDAHAIADKLIANAREILGGGSR